MSQLGVTIAESFVSHRGVRRPQRTPARANANIGTPFYRSPLYATVLTTLTLIAGFAMAGALWRLFHFAH